MVLFISQYLVLGVFFNFKQDLKFPVCFTMITPESPDLICTLAELFSLKQIMTLVKVNSWNWYNMNKLQLHPDDQHSEKMITELRYCREVISWLSWKTAPVMDFKVSHWLFSSWSLVTHYSVLNRKEMLFLLFSCAGTWRISLQKLIIQDESARRTNLFLMSWLAHRYWVLNESMVPSLTGLFYLAAWNYSFWEKCYSIFTLLSEQTQWYQRLSHNITLDWNSNLSLQWRICSDILLGVLNLPYYLICVCIDLKHRNFMLSASQWLIEWYICSVLVSILRKVINQECI